MNAATLVTDLLQRDPWLATVSLAFAAVVVALVVHHVGGHLARRATRQAPVLHAVLTAMEQPAGAAMPLFALQLVWQVAPDTLREIGHVRHINGLLLIAALTWLAMAAIRGVATGVIARHPVDVEDNMQARRIHTQARVLARSAMTVVLIAGAAMILMTFPGARQVGASLLASAGVLGIIGGLAARPVFSNLIAGLQLALAQPLRLDDVLIVNGEWGRVEEITGTYVVLRIWDQRRLIIPLQWFIENPFQNWTRSSSEILGTVFLSVDYAMPVEALRAEGKRLVEEAPEWDRRVFVVQVTDTTETTMQIRVLVSAADSGKAFDLRCRVREGLLAFMAREYPQHLPLRRHSVLERAAEPGT
ncbi:mechanosensitive ion channel family protein [Ramlibacter algicola]|uniref:mechanosensitive ion channel family protein n=1 Tax=Ramlibacter algicola TaxID=2795217 RepID=UPI001EF035F9|nr:mechanosensitive ion channel family protein [Ramlibacter algicola]